MLKPFIIMNHRRNILSLPALLFLFLICFHAQAQEPAKPFNIGLYGYIDYEIVTDSRQVVNAREANVLLYPENIRLDPDGNDLNAVPNFNFTILSSRMGMRINGPEVLGAKVEGLFEVDFLGTRADNFGLMRLRHALIKLKWENAELLAGQFWHPFFVPECYPHTVMFAGGAPYHALNRSPQLRFTLKANSLNASLILLSQSDFASLGPAGSSTRYIRNSFFPETHLQLVFRESNFLLGINAGLQALKPRTETVAGYRTTELMINPQLNVFSSLKVKNSTFKIQAYYNENNTHLVMLGGYGEAELLNAEKAIYDYSGIRAVTAWADAETAIGKMKAGFLAGYAHNLGSDKALTGNVWGRGLNIERMFRLAPRLIYTSGKTDFGLELMYDRAFYGTPDEFYQVKNGQGVGNLRTVFLIKYNFAT